MYTVCPKTPNIPVFLRQAGNTYHKYFNVIHKDDITKTFFLMRFINIIIMILMRFIKMTVVKSDFFWISKAHNTDNLLS